MIEYIKIRYAFDPVQAVYHKSKIQDDHNLAGQFPDLIRIERNQSQHIRCNIVLSRFSGIRWQLITGLVPVEPCSSYYVGNQVVSPADAKKKTAMIIANTNVQAGEMIIYLFPDYDVNGMEKRCAAARSFISNVCKVKQPKYKNTRAGM